MWCYDCSISRGDAATNLDVVPGDGTSGGKNSGISTIPVDLGLKEAKLKKSNSKKGDEFEAMDPKTYSSPTHELLKMKVETGRGPMSNETFRALIKSTTMRDTKLQDPELVVEQVDLNGDLRRWSCTRCCLEEADSERCDRSLWSWALRFLCFLVLCTLSFITMVAVLGNQVGDELTIEVHQEWVGTPDNLVDALRAECVDLQRQATAFIGAIEEYNRQQGFRQVTFTTRERQKQASAMYLPSTGPARVVVVHGRRQHGLSSSAQTAGYLLRLMGISSLIITDLTSVRENVSDWLADELTILGAWDYVVADPDSLLGGAVNPQEVGLIGFDFGGFSVQRAFAQELQIPAILLDGVVHNFKVLMNAKVQEVFELVPGLQPLFTSQVQSRCELNLQKRVDEVSSLADDFAQRSTANKSYIGMMRSSEDAVIPDGATQAAESRLSAQSLPSDSILLDWTTTFSGPKSDACWEQRALHLSRTQEYQTQLCAFFSRALEVRVNCTAVGFALDAL